MSQSLEALRQLFVVGSRGRCRQSGGSPKRHPGPAIPVQLVDPEIRFLQEGREVDVFLEVAKRARKALKARADRERDILEHDLSGDPVKLHRAARRQQRESFVDLPAQFAAGNAGERPKSQIETEVPVCLADEIEDGQAVLVLRAPEPPAQLLKEDRCALRRPKKQDGIDLGKVDALVEQVYREEDVYLAVFEPFQRRIPLLLARVGRNRCSWNSRLHEFSCHELCVPNAHAEAECPHPSPIRDLFEKFLNDQCGPRVVGSVEILEFGGVISPATPCDVRDVDVVV
jgi:hypothetical protein